MTPELLPFLCAADVVLLLVGLWSAWRLRWRGPRREVLALVAFGIAAALALALPARAIAPNPGFSVLRAACHALFCVLLPVCAGRGLRLRALGAPRVGATLLLAALAGEGCYVWAREVEPFRLEVTRETITSPRLRGLPHPLRIAVVADLQPEDVGPYEVSVFDTIAAAGPDLVLFLGDYIQQDADGFVRQRDLLHRQLARLHPPLGMFAVEGDVDWRGLDAVFDGTAVRRLVDDHADLPGVPVAVVGLSRARSRRTTVDAGLARHFAGERFPIVIAHAPDYMRCVLDTDRRPDALLLAGHTHGGQVQVPGFGPLVTLSSVPRWLAGGGVFRRGDSWLAVSRGIGMEREDAPRIRFWCRPQLLLLDLAEAP